eukprot:CAMPEP_0201283088 /NCGR_PEP_ID=MMETSP1317-20130820/7558_1 /ASSEMBLY_ACC=CAM_ASM_000770 /TAXON_ID=187299 /ORGANISM="Undescribed Undescribed, Strain Undescribed" /LENGTH=43 /DNA_ID= /DNA_START= /DNA_END= /DNA_ORIENTATION=
MTTPATIQGTAFPKSSITSSSDSSSSSFSSSFSSAFLTRNFLD